MLHSRRITARTTSAFRSSDYYPRDAVAGPRFRIAVAGRASVLSASGGGSGRIKVARTLSKFQSPGITPPPFRISGKTPSKARQHGPPVNFAKLSTGENG